MGWLTQNELAREAASAHALVLIPWSAGNRQVVPSKLYEYAGYNRPVLLAGPDSGGVASLLAELEHPDVIAGTAERIAERLRSALEGNFQGYFQKSQCRVMPLHENALGRQYVQWLEQAISSTGGRSSTRRVGPVGNGDTLSSES
jgi:hypothetical protein